MEQSKFSFDVFLSHNSKDKPLVRRLAERLRAEGVRVWLDEWLIQPGDDIYLTIERGLETSRTLVLCMSPNAFGSDWVGLERSTVLFRDPSNADRRFIPLMLADCDPPDTLRRFKYVDFREESDTVFEKLLTACRAKVTPEEPTRQPKRNTKRTAKKLPEKRADTLALLERKLTGHTDWINSIAVSPDGLWLASCSKDQTVKIWDIETGECRATLKGHTKGKNSEEGVRSLAITPDGRTLFSGGSDKTIRRWQVSSHKPASVLHGHNHHIMEMAIFDDGTRLVSCSANEDPPTIRLWDITDNKPLSVIKDEGNPCVNSITVSMSGDKLISGGSDGKVKIWNVANGKRLVVLEGHSDSVNSVQLTPDGRFAVSGSNDKTVKIWNLDTNTCAGTLEGHKALIASVALSPDGSLIASAGFTDHTVRLWDRISGVCLQVIQNEQYFTAYSVAFSPNGSRLLVGTTSGEIYIYHLNRALHAPSTEINRRYVNAKVVLVGEGTVGKTSLAHRLIDDEYVIRDRTHGMNVWRLDLPLPPEDTLEREALLWDLAGQEDYRLIHQLFLDETALALLLVNPHKEDLFAEAGDWLKAIKTAVNGQNANREAAKLMIFSHIDVGGMKISNAKIERFREQHGFTGWLPTSAKTGENCSDHANGGQPSALKRLIAESIPWDTLPWTSTPRLLAELKNAVVTMRDQTDIRLIRFAELAQRLEQALPMVTFGESEIRTALTLLANHGLARPLKFGDLVLLRPDLLNGYAGAIIRAARAHTDEIGCVAEKDIYRADFDFTGVERLNRPDEELLLRALVQTFLEHSLCIAEETQDGRHLVFPSQYRREREIPKHPDIFVSYTFCGEWQTIYTTLVVRLWYSQEFGHRELWRNAAEFQTSKGHTLGLKINNKQGEGEATISLFFDVKVPDELKVIFIEYIHRHLEKYAREVQRDRRYVCPACAKPVTDLEAVRERFEMKKEFIYCQKCDEKVPLIDFIEQRLASDPVAQKVLRMDEMATQELDAQALEQILIGHMMAITGEANQIFRPVTMFDYGIDGELEFKDNDGKASGKKIYIQLKSGSSYLRSRKSDGNEIYDVKNKRHLKYWENQPVDVYLVIRQQDERTGVSSIRWMNVTRYLKEREDKDSKQIVFNGEKLDASAVWRVRDIFFHPEG
jgi:WD40 repeat protein/uncharacterized protein YbaR (Trm112 family)